MALSVLRRSFLRALQWGSPNASWERLPGWYVRWRLVRQLGSWDSPPRRALRLEIAEVGGSVLEVACGPGIEYGGINKAGLQVRYVGVDITPTMIAICQRNYPGITFQVAGVDSLPFPDSSFDTVFAKDLFEHLPGYETGLREMFRVTKRQVLIYFFLPLTEGTAEQGIHPESGFLYNHYSRAELERFARSLNPRSVEITRINDRNSEGHLVKIEKA